MRTPSIAHYGITIVEQAPPADADQRAVPITGVLERNLAFLRVLGFEPHVENFYAGVGRQYIWRRGREGDVDYVEQDNFTSYSAQPRPHTAGPRQGDSVFRLTHRDPANALRTLRAEGLVAVDATAADAFMRGERSWVLIAAPSGQQYEFGATAETAADNHRVYVWTAAADVDRVCTQYRRHFGLSHVESGDFHGIGRVELLRRAAPGVSIGVLHDPVAGLAPRWSEDIFGEAGYTHFRLGAVDKPATEAIARQAFPPGGDVAYVYFEDSYLELVQA